MSDEEHRCRGIIWCLDERNTTNPFAIGRNSGVIRRTQQKPFTHIRARIRSPSVLCLGYMDGDGLSRAYLATDSGDIDIYTNSPPGSANAK